MKKYIAILTLAAALLTFTACNSSDGISETTQSYTSNDSVPEENTHSESDDISRQSKDSADSDVTLGDIEAAIADALGDGYLCTAEVPEDELILSCIGWLDMDRVDEYIVKQPAVYAQDAVGIVRCKEGYADEAVNTLNERFAQSIGYIRKYPFDVAKVEGTRIYKVGDIVMYITAGAQADVDSSREDEARLADTEYEKIDNALGELLGSIPENLAVIPKDSGNNGGGLLLGGVKN